jgi:hypothetical protein
VIREHRVLGDSEGWWSWWLTLQSGSLVARLDKQRFAMVVEILDAFKKAKKELFAPPCEDGMDTS